MEAVIAQLLRIWNAWGKSSQFEMRLVQFALCMATGTQTRYEIDGKLQEKNPVVITSETAHRTHGAPAQGHEVSQPTPAARLTFSGD